VDEEAATAKTKETGHRDEDYVGLEELRHYIGEDSAEIN